jgi:hypothetical protein
LIHLCYGRDIGRSIKHQEALVLKQASILALQPLSTRSSLIPAPLQQPWHTCGNQPGPKNPTLVPTKTLNPPIPTTIIMAFSHLPTHWHLQQHERCPLRQRFLPRNEGAFSTHSVSPLTPPSMLHRQSSALRWQTCRRRRRGLPMSDRSSRGFRPRRGGGTRRRIA